MGVKQGYNQTEVGIIPEDWNISPLKELTKSIISGRSKSGNQIGTYPVYGSTGIIGYTEHPEYEGEAILVARVGANAGKINSVSGKYSVTDNTIIIKVKEDNSFSFLTQLLEVKKINDLVFGSGQPLITGSQLKSLKFATPKIFEQKLITNILNDINSLIHSFDKLIKKKDYLKKTITHQLLTGSIRLKGFSEVWKLKRLGNLITKIHSGGTPKTSIEDYFGGDIPWVSISDMTKKGKIILDTERNLTSLGFSNCSAKLFKPGTVLFAMYASLGECSIAGVELCSSQAILGITCGSNLNNEFLYYYLNYKKSYIKSLGQQGTQSNLNKSMVEDFELYLPPTMKEQVAITKILNDIDNDLDKLIIKKEKILNLKKTTMFELLRGNIRLVKPENINA